MQLESILANLGAQNMKYLQAVVHIIQSGGDRIEECMNN